MEFKGRLCKTDCWQSWVQGSKHSREVIFILIQINTIGELSFLVPGTPTLILSLTRPTSEVRVGCSSLHPGVTSASGAVTPDPSQEARWVPSCRPADDTRREATYTSPGGLLLRHPHFEQTTCDMLLVAEKKKKRCAVAAYRSHQRVHARLVVITPCCSYPCSLVHAVSTLNPQPQPHRWCHSCGHSPAKHTVQSHPGPYPGCLPGATTMV